MILASQKYCNNLLNINRLPLALLAKGDLLGSLVNVSISKWSNTGNRFFSSSSPWWQQVLAARMTSRRGRGIQRQPPADSIFGRRRDPCKHSCASGRSLLYDLLTFCTLKRLSLKYSKDVRWGIRDKLSIALFDFANSCPQLQVQR